MRKEKRCLKETIWYCTMWLIAYCNAMELKHGQYTWWSEKTIRYQGKLSRREKWHRWGNINVFLGGGIFRGNPSSVTFAPSRWCHLNLYALNATGVKNIHWLKMVELGKQNYFVRLFYELRIKLWIACCVNKPCQCA